MSTGPQGTIRLPAMWQRHEADDPDTYDIRLKTLARLRRVNKQLAAWDEVDAMELMPNSLRPHVEQPRLDREQLKALQLILVDELRELENGLNRS
jgi:hypothetical protein